MRAAWIERTGPAAEVLIVGEMPDPKPGPGEVLVRVRASGVNPSDIKHRGGWRQAKLRFPRVVPQSDGAGEIVAVGAGVAGSRIGERVWLWGAASPYDTDRPFGTAAELVALPAAQAVRLSDAASFVEGACLGIPACTAHRAVWADGSVAGRTVLVQGGAGAVGRYAVQFAARDGARVIATVSGAAKAAHALAAGAHETIDRAREDVAARVLALTGGQGVDRIVEVDFGANMAIDAATLKSYGAIASYSSPSAPNPTIDYYAFQFRGAQIQLIQVYTLPKAARAAAEADLARLADAGKIDHAIDSTFPLAGIAEAHLRLESGKAMGKVVIEID